MQYDEIIIGSFRGEWAGKGGFATVYRVTDSNSRPFALKLVDPDADDAIRDSLYHEYTVQSELIHPQVVHAHAFGIHENRPYVVFDWVDGTELFGRFTAPSSEDFIEILRQVARVMLFVHHRGWVHGDLKPENFLWRITTEGKHELCLLDFGLARPIGDADRPRGAGTVGYCAPEFLNNLPADGRADWYAVGVILYEWIFGVRPYASDDPAIEIGGHLEGSPDFDLARQRPAPEWADEVIKRLLGKSADERADDELALLVWLSRFEPDLEPTALLNEQLTWHSRSEAARLRTNESDILYLLHHDLSSGSAVRWSIASHGASSTALRDRIAALCSRIGYEIACDTESYGIWIMRDRTAQNANDARVEIRFSQSAGNGIHSESDASSRCMTLLQWDREEIRMYLRGIIGDDDVAETWTDEVHAATCGLPRAVSAALHSLIDHGQLNIDSDGWEIDDKALRQWRDSNLPHYLDSALGVLSAQEQQLCQWLALGEGEGARVVIARLPEMDESTVNDAISALRERGIVICDCQECTNRFNLRLRLHGHDEIIRATMPSGIQSQMSRALAESISGMVPEPDKTRARILGHAFSRAGIWDKSAEQFSLAASFAIASDDRELAMRFIALAQESAGCIEDENQRRHWIGHARMVEGDLQKAAGQLDVARQIYRELLGLCRKTGDLRLLAETLHDLGDLYRIVRSHAKGIRVERRALRIWESLGDRAQASRSLNSLGNFHRLSSDLPRAREFYQQALEIQRELGFEQFAATNLNNLGLICWQENNFSDAEGYFHEAIAVHERLNATVEIARVLNNLGAISFVQGNLDESEGFFTRAAELNAAAGAQSEELYNHRNLAEVALERGDLRSAVSLGQQVHSASMDLGDVSTSVEVAAVLADAYLRAGDYRSAFRLNRETMDRLSSIKNDEISVYLHLQQVAALLTFNRAAEALTLLDSVAPKDARLPTPYLQVDSSILRLSALASLGHEEQLLKRTLMDTLNKCDAIGAPHKAAYAAVVGLTATTDAPLHSELVRRISDLLSHRPRWHWVAAYQAWQAREQMKARQLDDALALISASIEQLRRDGGWEQLWRSLVLQAEICHTQADYEPAMRALEEAASLLKIVASTVDEDTQRTIYLNCADAQTLERTRNRITELVS